MAPLIQMTEIRTNFRLSEVWHTWATVERRDNQTGSNAINICGNAELVTSARFHLISVADVCNLAGWSYCSGLEAGATHDLPLDGGSARWLCGAYIFMPPLRCARDGCLRLIRRSKVVSYGKPQRICWSLMAVFDNVWSRVRLSTF